MRSLLIGLAMTVALTGCQAQGLLTPPVSRPGETSTTPLKLGSLQFQPVSADVAAQLASRQQQGSAARMAAPEAAAAGAPTADTAMVAADAKMMPAPYYFGSYFGGPFGQMKLDSVQEATTSGSAGGWAEIQGSLIGPVVAEWAADARLVQTNGMLDGEGNPLTGKENYPGENAWRAAYASIARNEVLEFTVTPAETKVIRLKWVPIQLDAAGLSVDPKAAIAKIKAAIADPAFQSKEQQLGHDYFFGKDGGGVGGVAVAMPAVRVAADTVVSSEGNTSSSGEVSILPAPEPGFAPGEPHPDAPPPDMPKEEPVYELASGGRWHANLQAIGDYTVWELSYSPAPETSDRAYQPGETFVNQYAYAMVDARTGDVIRLQRPMRITIPVYEVRPMPAEKPTEPSLAAQ